MSNPVLVTAPAIEPITVAEARTHLRLDAAYGEPAPAALTAALASPAVAGNVDNGAHRYRVTFVTADGETEGGTISSAVTVADKTVNGQIALTGIPTGGSAVTSRKIYRTTAGGSTYLLLTTIADNTTTTSTDNTADSALGAAAPTTNSTVDPEVVRLITVARELVETHTGRTLITSTWDYYLPAFPASGIITLPNSPLQSVTSITYTDSAGTATVWASSNYQVSIRGAVGRIVPAYSVSWPTFTARPLDAVTVRYVAGYGSGAGDVPEGIRQAMLLLIGHLYEQREATGATVAGSPLPMLPFGVDALLATHWAKGF